MARQKLGGVRRAVVVTPVADLMERPEAESPLADQALFGDTVEIIAAPAGDCALPGGRFFLIETAARYRGYIQVQSLMPWPEPAPPYRSGALWRVVSRFTNVYPQPDLTRSNPLVVLPLGVAMRPVRELSERWVEVALPDGRHGFAQRGDLQKEPQPPALTRACIVEQALAHEGSPYLWGGRSTYGIDCSGLVSNAYEACGVTVPRDAHQQFEWQSMRPVGQPTAEAISELQPGDLLFFVSADAPPVSPQAPDGKLPGKPPGKLKITHVGVYIGDGQFVHATTSDRPTVHKTTLREPGWLKRWAGTRRHEQLAAQAP
ncbi:MAG TPA: C40 family peptidase [Pseudomonadota bacterium]|nr:C40 family peptidase [Pseudomonadota bacterium]